MYMREGHLLAMGLSFEIWLLEVDGPKICLTLLGRLAARKPPWRIARTSMEYADLMARNMR